MKAWKVFDKYCECGTEIAYAETAGKHGTMQTVSNVHLKCLHGCLCRKPMKGEQKNGNRHI